MKKNIIMSSILVCSFSIGCAEKATQEQIDKMCENLADLSGVLKASSEVEEGARIEAEFNAKMKANRDELERDLKGLDDVLAVKLAEIEKVPAKTPEELEEIKKNLKEDEEMPPTKEEQIAALKADFEKKKEEVRGPLNHEYETLKPRMEREKKDVMKVAREKHEKQVKIIADCQAKSKGITLETAKCRTNANTVDWFWKKCK